MPLIQGHEHLGDLRPLDLIAKTSKTSIRDVMRVLIAARMVGQHFDMTLGEMLPSDYNSGSRPTPANVAACEQAFSELTKLGSERALEALDQYK